MTDHRFVHRSRYRSPAVRRRTTDGRMGQSTSEQPHSVGCVYDDVECGPLFLHKSVLFCSVLFGVGSLLSCFLTACWVPCRAVLCRAVACRGVLPQPGHLPALHWCPRKNAPSRAVPLVPLLPARLSTSWLVARWPRWLFRALHTTLVLFCGWCMMLCILISYLVSQSVSQSVSPLRAGVSLGPSVRWWCD